MNTFGFFRGSVKYKVKTEKIPLVIDKIRKMTAIREIETDNVENLSFSVLYNDRKAVDLILEETDSVCIERKCKGIAYLLSKYRKRAGIAAGCALIAFLVLLSGQYVWEIRVEGNENVKDAEIIEQLKKEGFYVGIRKKNADTEKYVNMLLVADDRISWAAINFDGTIAHVEIKEAKRAEFAEKKENVNLVASHDGIILRVDAIDGSAAVNKGDTVVRGQMLVSAFLKKRTGGSLLRGARGYVWANTKRNYAVVVPLTFSEKRYTGNVETIRDFSVLGKSFRLSDFGNNKYKYADLICASGKLVLLDKLSLPVEMSLARISEYEKYTVRRTEQTALECARKTALERLYRDSPQFKTADVSETYEIEDEKLIYICSFDGVENIAVPLEFELS